MLKVTRERAATRREESMRDCVDRKPQRWPSDKIDRGDRGNPPPPPKERVATDDRKASLLAWEVLNRKLL